MRKKTLILMIVFSVLVVTSYPCWAQNVIYSCVTKSTGNIRIVATPGSCKNNEALLSWNIAGPQGPQGLQGPAGEKGATGEQGPPGVTLPPTPFANSAILDGALQARLNNLYGNPFQTWTRCYQMTTDGDADAFHSGCDRRGPTITVLKTDAGKILGGYTEVEWQTALGYSYTGNYGSFLFSLDANRRYPIGANKQFPADYNEAWDAILNGSGGYGPTFGGGHDLYTNLNGALGYCYFPYSYVCANRVQVAGGLSECQIEFCGVTGSPDAGNLFGIAELEVFVRD